MKTAFNMILVLLLSAGIAGAVTGCKKSDTSKPSQESVKDKVPDEPAQVFDEPAPLPGEKNTK